MKAILFWLLAPVLTQHPGMSGATEARIAGRIVDADTGETMPVTVTIRLASGAVIREHPSYNRGFRSSGVFEKTVPAGPATVTVRRGFDYGAITRTVDVAAGERVELNFALRRRTPLRRLGWYCGDSHVHMIHGQREITADFPYVAIAARAEALDYMSLAQRWAVAEETPEALEQECRKVSTPDFLLTWNLEAPKNYWRGDVSYCMGHGWTLGMGGRTREGRDAIRLLDALNAHDYEEQKTPAPNFDTQALVHQLGGIVSYTHPCRWWRGKWGGKGGYPVEENKFISNLAAELPFDTIAGPTYDTIDILMQTSEREVNENGQKLWFMLLNHAYRIPGTASSDASFDNPGRGVPGAVRVYTRVEGEPTIDKIKTAMRAGRNFVTSGPLLLLRLGEHQPGDVVRVNGPAKFRVSLRAWASGEPGETIKSIDLIRNGEVVKTFSFDAAAPEVSRDFDIEEAQTAWYAARCSGSSFTQIAITNPIYFEDSTYRAPKAAPARVQVAVVDHAGKPVTATCEVLAADGGRAVMQSTHKVREGRLDLVAPATARLRVSAPGYRPMTKSIFVDVAALSGQAFNMRVEQLLNWSTYERITEILRDVRMEFRMESQ